MYNETAKLFSLKHEFATEWYKFLNPIVTADQELIINLNPEHFHSLSAVSYLPFKLKR